MSPFSNRSMSLPPLEEILGFPSTPTNPQPRSQLNSTHPTTNEIDDSNDVDDIGHLNHESAESGTNRSLVFKIILIVFLQTSTDFTVTENTDVLDIQAMDTESSQQRFQSPLNALNSEREIALRGSLNNTSDGLSLELSRNPAQHVRELSEFIYSTPDTALHKTITLRMDGSTAVDAGGVFRDRIGSVQGRRPNFQSGDQWNLIQRSRILYSAIKILYSAIKRQLYRC